LLQKQLKGVRVHI